MSATALLLYLLSAQAAPEPLVPRERIKPLELVAPQLARAGREPETLELLAILDGLGLPKTAADTLRQSCLKDLARAKKPLAALPDAARSLRSTARGLAALIPTLDDTRRVQLAELVLRLDETQADAHSVLDHDFVDGRWQVAGEQKRKERRTAIQRALQDARRLPLELQVAVSEHPLPAKLYPGERLHLVKWGHIRLHTPYSPEKATRILREALRATAFMRFLVDKPLAAPDRETSAWVLLDRKDKYLAAVDELQHRGSLNEADAARARQVATVHLEAESVTHKELEGEASATLTYYFTSDIESSMQPCLYAGLLHWTCLAYLGQPAPTISWTEVKEGAGGSGRTVTSAIGAKAEREEMFRLAQAGLVGCRSWMRWLAARREDPPYSNAMQDAMGKIQGNDLLKATSVVEMLLEERRFVDLAKRTRVGDTWNPNQVPRFEAALSTTITVFEEQWRRWILGAADSLASRIDKQQVRGLSAAEKECLDHLQSLRGAAFAEPPAFVRTPIPVTLDESLSRGARAHAVYLDRHPEQAAAWPDAHEEYPDKEGFSPEGAWAAGRSVIAPGVGSSRQALDAWMGTFYHRLPLLHPGLLRVGFGLEKKVAVLDADSLCEPVRSEWVVVWPPQGANGVPIRFMPELPNPVPDQDQGNFGYPVTLQLGPRADESANEVRMRLLEGGLRGVEVPCWFSSPSQPTNPRLAPADAWCLIPKAPLKAGITYGVRAQVSGKSLEWTFRT